MNSQAPFSAPKSLGGATLQIDANTWELSARLQAAEAALQRSERMAMASRYAGAIMHEVNNPLEALTNLVYLTQNMAENPAKVRGNMELAETQLSNLGEITRRALSFYRDQVEPKEFDLVEIADSALKIHSHRARRQNVQIRNRAEGPALAQVYAGEILQILSNLILNSFDALPNDGGVLSLRIRKCNDKVHITIADNGTGMDPAIYEKLFEPHTTTKSEGTGLGLWLSRRIVEQHNGKITCRSSRTPGRSGTTFRVSLPLTQTGTAITEGRSEPSVASAATAREMTNPAVFHQRSTEPITSNHQAGATVPRH